MPSDSAHIALKILLAAENFIEFLFQVLNYYRAAVAVIFSVLKFNIFFLFLSFLCLAPSPHNPTPTSRY